MTSTATIIRITGKDQTPGPGAYMPPSDFGRAPAWTIKKRLPERTSSNTAGYTVLPNTVGQGRKSALASRHSTRDYSNTPGPSYVPPRFGSEAHSSSMHQRLNRPEARAVSPGPAAYEYKTSSLSGPKFTMKSRKFPPDEVSHDAPGAAAYGPKYDYIMPSAQKRTIGDRLKEVRCDVTPGPGQYVIDRRPQSQLASFHIKRREPKYDDIPGPGKYDTSVPCGRETPKYTIRPRIQEVRKTIDPAYQKIPDVFGREARKSSLGSRHKDVQQTNPVGPSYVPPPFGSTARKSALASRHSVRDRSTPMETPGAGRYDVPSDGMKGKRAPKWTMKGRNFPPNEDEHAGPGPAANAPDYTKMLPQGRKTQILEKFHEPKKEQGPGYYDPEKPPTGPKWTIGRKEDLGITPGGG
ncbi:hypothetical protein TRFO_17474 [Tritrichomonas foetus]|uniref:Outer dense fiber protein 3 n=1 Tax=Tritrichomonas foetus TaxID=1144522 RepID=A0A1J4KMW0_9EUKA|nr:hypothetical protein TRFO_17474 [Tritrichomonas foetus]|eukprot:OHT12649.1 hypothetical protein TRFO_17474 [Tritrichomonas foetus]